MAINEILAVSLLGGRREPEETRMVEKESRRIFQSISEFHLEKTQKTTEHLRQESRLNQNRFLFFYVLLTVYLSITLVND